MAALRTDPLAYEPLTRRYGAHVRGTLAELWADKARLRRLLMIWGVAAVAIVALAVYLMGGRYVGTDDAYVHAAKLMVSTDVSGLVKDVDVREGQHVKKGQVLFRLDPRPFQIALENAKAALAQTAQDVESTRATYRSILGQIAAQEAQVRLAQLTYDRYLALLKSNAIAPTQVDQARGALQSAAATLISLKQNAAVQLAKLNGDPNTPAERTPDYQKAKANVDEMQRQLDHATVRAPFDGVVSEVDSLQPGTLVISAMSAFTTTSAVGLVSEKNIWIEADMKETDLTYVRRGNPASVTVDTYGGCVWHGHVATVSPASDSAFSALPAENASGNWVKVVQRIPTKIFLDRSDCKAPLRAGMSAVVTIDTGKRRWERMLSGG
ncbi:MAG TPA: HlyD family secretion protein [Rhizomicrobium sp.]|jgi:membrane fusion protein (multidrug efflux system)|nr:HlyD family secretion protein [Rhizomicrobium sp.]HWA23535.1 HlyD family secretion protein [Caulobacterales bacterium]